MSAHDNVRHGPEAQLLTPAMPRGRFLKALAAAGLAGGILPALGQRSLAAPAKAQALDKELNFYNWASWVGPTEIPRFEKKYGVKVRQDTYASNDELYAKLRAGGGSQYDVMIPTSYAIRRMITQGMLKKLDYASIPNAKHLAPDFRTTDYDPGNAYSIPNDWGYVGIMYRTDLVPENITGWADVWRLASKYHRKIVCLATPRDVIGVGLVMNGFSVNTRDHNQLSKARDTLLQLKPHILEITSSDQRAALLRGDAAIVMDWNEEAPTAMADKKVGKFVRWIPPKEGLVGYVDALAIPAGAPHPYTAEVFINWLLEPANYAEFVNYDTTAYTMQNNSAISKLLQDPIVNPPPAIFRRIQFQTYVGAAQPVYDRVWTEFKAA